ncbi:MAG: CinA family nicotinamide mononucleotide deamidase-related protein [Anaerolineales bacterium]|nr:CinA family nicotinamide mononucleotide deamidase-related protein [Anaerolineales bacterium]
MHAEIVMTGSELLLGEIVDTNATMMAKMLRNIGLNLFYKTTVGDNEERITQVLNIALDRSPVVITSGGLGPTVDDVTRQAVANATGRRLVYSEELEAQIAARFRSFGRPMADNNRRQAYLPEGALPLPNPAGTAPCFLSEDTRGRGFIISLPGVPRELEYMMTHTVIPLLVERMGGAKIIKARVLRTCAVGESNIDRAIGDLMLERNPTVGLSAHAGQTDVRITAKADSEAEADALIAAMEARLRERLGVAIYGVDKETVAEIVGRLLAEKGLKLGVVDTLTGGQLARELIEAGFREALVADVTANTPAEAAAAVGLTPIPADGDAFAGALAQAVTPADGVGLAILGPLSDGTDDRLTFIAVHGPPPVYGGGGSQPRSQLPGQRPYPPLDGHPGVRLGAASGVGTVEFAGGLELKITLC